MSFELMGARHWARALMEQKLESGMTVIDATMGNGGDTEWLCEAVGAQGTVWAFDVQPDAVERTREKLRSADVLERARLILCGHERMGEMVIGPVDAVLFNLGWLPGGDKRITTQVQTTLTALDAALSLLKPGGLLTVCAYPGHDEGEREYEAVVEWAKALPKGRFQARVTAYLNQPPNTPAMLAVHRIR